MGNIDFGQDCLLTHKLKEVSMAESNLKAQFAGSLLCELGYPHFTRQCPDIKFIELLLQEIAKTDQADLLSEVADECASCPHSGRCELELLFNAV